MSEILSDAEKQALIDTTGLILPGDARYDPNHKENEIFYRKKIPFFPPDLKSLSVTDSFLYRIEDVEVLFCGVKYKLDVFTSLLRLAGLDYILELTKELTQEQKQDLEKVRNQKRFLAKNVARIFVRDLDRIAFSAQIGDIDSLESLAALRNIAKTSGKIAYILTHGYIDHTYKSERDWYITDSEGRAYSAQSIVWDVGKRKTGVTGKSKYGLVYLGACNENDRRIAMGNIGNWDHIPIPVIAHKEINGPTPVSVRVYWP